MFVAACGDDTPGETPDAGTTLDAGFDGALPPRDADVADGALPGMDAGVVDGAPPGMDADVVDGGMLAMDADVGDGGMSAMDADVADGGMSSGDSGSPDGGMPAMDAGADAGVDAGPPGCSPAACDDGVSCTEDVCSEDGRCVHRLLETACARGQYCDLARGCVNGAVCSTDAECADSDPCTTMERCDTSFPRRCTHRILDADADRETTTACGGGDCNDASNTVSMMAHQVCGSAVDADCDGLVALDDLLGTTACANDVLVGGLAACPSTPIDVGGFVNRVVDVAENPLDPSLCSDPFVAVQALAVCQSTAACDASNACVVGVSLGLTPSDVSFSVNVAFTDCRAAYRAACACAGSSVRCATTWDSLCDSNCRLSDGNACIASDIRGAPERVNAFETVDMRNLCCVRGDGRRAA